MLQYLAFNFKPLHLTASKDGLRESLNYVHLSNDKVISTDAHLLSHFKTVSLFGDEKEPEDIRKFFVNGNFYIHREEWAKLNPYNLVAWKDEEQTVLKFMDSKGKKRPLLIEISRDIIYPNFEEILPNIYKKQFTTDNFVLGLDLKHTITIQKILGDRVVFEFSNDISKGQFNRVKHIIVSSLGDFEKYSDNKRNIDYVLYMPLGLYADIIGRRYFE